MDISVCAADITEQEDFCIMYCNYMHELNGFVSSCSITQDIERDACEEFAYYMLTEAVTIYMIKRYKQIIGFCTVEVYPLSATYNHASFFIKDFYIMPEHREKGFGLSAVMEILDFYVGTGALLVLDKNLVAQKFWNKVLKECSEIIAVEPWTDNITMYTFRPI